MQMKHSPKIALLGAGSMVFSKNVIADILWHEALAGSEIALVDVDAERLRAAETMARTIAGQLKSGAKITATADRRTVLAGADFVICCIGVGGYAATEIDLRVPASFGLRQTVGDTLGVGGIFRSVRSIPVLLEICRDMTELCPNALLINYTNPMAMHCLAVERAYPVIRHVGLCHGVQNTAQLLRALTRLLDITPEAVTTHFNRPHSDPEREREWVNWMALGVDPKLHYTCAGINHMAFFLRFESSQEDLYPLLRKAATIPHLCRFDHIRLALFRRLGYCMTETSGHMAEYVPYFLKDDAEIAANELRPSAYLDACVDLDGVFQAMKRSLAAGKPVIATPYQPSNEHVSRIVNAVMTGVPYVFNGNVHNRNGALIANLPGDCCVEVPCVADRQGIRPTSVGELPPQCAALIRTNVNVQDLTVRGILEGDRTRIRQAVMFDPNTAAQLTLAKIDQVTEAMFAAHATAGNLPANLRG